MATAWRNTYLDDIAKYGATAPMGAGPYGATRWTALVVDVIAWDSTSLEDPPISTTWEVSQ